MKSNKQRRTEIKAKRLQRAEKAMEQWQADHAYGQWVVQSKMETPPAGMVLANTQLLALHSTNSYGILPTFYIDLKFTCRDCNDTAIWTAKQQKWWYEDRLGDINSQAIRCLPCRRIKRANIEKSRATSGANLLQELSANIRALSEQTPNPQAYIEIEQALQSKWWGLRHTAINVLGHWGRREDIRFLKSMLKTGSQKFGDWEHQKYYSIAKILKKSPR